VIKLATIQIKNNTFNALNLKFWIFIVEIFSLPVRCKEDLTNASKIFYDKMNMGKIRKYFPYFGFLLFLLTSVFVSVLFAVQKKTSWPSRAEEDKAQLWLLPTKVELRQGEETTVRVFLVTRINESGGVDLVLKYNPNLLEIVDNTVKPGMIFDYYRDRLVDNRRGIIRLSSSGNFKGEGTFATFSVKGKAVGSGKIEFVSTKDSVNATVVWDSQEKENILGATYNLSFEVR
jgi:hypothetical protein